VSGWPQIAVQPWKTMPDPRYTGRSQDTPAVLNRVGDRIIAHARHEWNLKFNTNAVRVDN